MKEALSRIANKIHAIVLNLRSSVIRMLKNASELRQSRNKDAIPNKDSNPSKQSLDKYSVVISFLAMLAAFIAIFVSIFSHFNNLNVTEKYRLENEHYKLIEVNRALDIKTNIEFWDYSINLLIDSMIQKYGFSDPLWNIASLVSSKQSGAAKKIIDKLEPQFRRDGEFQLLKCCIILRNNIVIGNYSRYSQNYELSDGYAKALLYGADEDQYRILIGIIQYFLDDVVGSAKSLKDAITMYDADSPFYNVANYWLAYISIIVRSYLCDADSFLKCAYEESSITNIMKSSIVFLFDVGDSSDTPMNFVVLVKEDASGTDAQTFTLNLQSNNPAKYLDSADDESVMDYFSQHSLYGLYDLCFQYSNAFYGKMEYRICEPNRLDEFNLHLLKIVEEYQKEYRLDIYSYLLNPSIEIDGSLRQSIMLYLQFENVFDSLIPFDMILDYCMMFSDYRAFGSNETYHYLYSNLYEFGAAYVNWGEDSYSRGSRAALALKYYEYCETGTPISKSDAAIVAYKAGYRYEFIYRELVEYYSSIKNKSEVNKLKDEMQILRFH